MFSMLLFLQVQAQTVVNYSTAGLGQTFTVPSGVNSIKVRAWGAAGGSYTGGVPYPNVGGSGGFAGATLVVTPGETLTIDVGGGGEGGTCCGARAGGINGGGNASGGAGGGGMTSIRRGSTYLVIAGGGGGAGNGTGGSGGGTEGSASTVCSSAGVGGSQTAGGLQQSCGSGATNGSQYQGGQGAQGGGGGGFYGGGGGACGCGGGGGSGYVTGTCTTLLTAPTGNYGFLGGIAANESDPYYNGTAGKGLQGATGNPGLLVVIYGGPVQGAPNLTGATGPCSATPTTYTTDVGMSSYIWNVTGGTITAGGGGNNNTITVRWNTAGTVSVSYTDCSSQSSTTTLNVTPVIADTPTVTITANPAGAICSGTPVTFSSVISHGGSNPGYQWKKNNIGAGVNATYTDNTLQNGDVITCVLTSNGTCISSTTATSNAITISVVQSVTAGSISSIRDSICEGESETLTVVGNSSSVRWQSSLNGTIFTDINGAINTSYTAQPSQSAYYRIFVGSGQCADSSQAYRLVVNELPASPVMSISDSLLCTGDSAQICASNTTGTYYWSTNANSNCITAKAAGAYWLTVTSADGCSVESARVNVHVLTPPAVSLTAEGDTLVAYGAVMYQWYFNGQPIQGATDSVHIAAETGNYSVKVTADNGCSSLSNSVYITVSGINERINKGAVRIYPNPVSDHITIAISGGTWVSGVRIINALGQQVWNSVWDTGSSMDIPVNGLPAGLFFVQLLNGKQVVFSSLIAK